MTLSFDAEMPQHLVTMLRERADTICAKWYRAIESTGFPELGEREVVDELRMLFDQLINALVREPFAPQQAEAIGAALVHLRYNTPETLAYTIDVLTTELLSAADAMSLALLVPRVGKDLGALAAGFCRERRRIILDEQEQIRDALVTARKKQDAVIQAQAAELAEVLTPLIPVSDTTVVMPLVGTVDERRTEQVMQTLLEGIAERNAHIAILDITGVTVVDSQVANGLIRAAQAARLVGAQVVLTGIRPEVAQTIVGLGIDLAQLVTRSTLQEGIAFALRQRS